MTLHFVFDDTGGYTPLARSLLRLAANALERDIPCQIYTTANTGGNSLAKPVGELAFAANPDDILVWLYAGEAPDIHLAERFPGMRTLVCECSAVAGMGNEQLLSLTRSFERVWGVDEATVQALGRLGFQEAEAWPLATNEGSSASCDSLLSGVAKWKRLPRANDSAMVSVVICTLNRAAHLESCLLQLRRQRFPRFEVIVVNGPSTDDTEAVLTKFTGEIKIRRNPKANLCISRNLGIAAAAGEIVAFLDDDSFAHPDWMREALTAFDDPLTAAVGGMSYRFRDETVEFSNGLLTETAYPWPIQPKPGSHHDGRDGLWNTVTGNNCLFRRDALLAVGGFDEQIPYTHDESNVVLKMARRGMRARHRPLAIVHHGSQPSLNRRDEFDLNWKVMVRDSIYCGYRNRPASAAAFPFLLRTLFEHARHRLYDPIDWWLYRRISFSGFLRIEWQCKLGFLAGTAKALLARPRPISTRLLEQSSEAFLLFPREPAPSNGSIVLLEECVSAAESLVQDGYRVNVLTDGSASSLDSRRGVFFHSVPGPTHADRPIVLWRKMQELAVRSGAYLLVTGPACNDALVIASDPRFQVLTLTSDSLATPATLTEQLNAQATDVEDRCPLMESISSELMIPSFGATRWRDPVYERNFWNLPPDGKQFLEANCKCALAAGRYRLDLFTGLDEAPREADAVCEVRLRGANGTALRITSFGESHFGETRWAILSTSFEVTESDSPLRLTVANVGFTGLRVQRAELRRWEIEPTRP